MKLTIGNLTIEADTQADFTFLESRIPVLSALVPQSRANGPSGSPSVSSGVWVGAWLAAHPESKRFRITAEESATWGDDREGAARARCESEGISAGGAETEAAEMPEDDGGDVM